MPEELSFGQKAVGLTFNPSGDVMVNILKKHYAMIIDELHDFKEAPEQSGETKRLCSVAITEAQTAQMWAVKAVTWSDS